MLSDETKDAAAKLAEERNAPLEEAARKKYAKGPIPKMRDGIVYLANRILHNLKSVREGSAPDALGAFTLDSLARILSTRTWLEFDGWSADDLIDMDNPETVIMDPEDVLVHAPVVAWTDEYGEWDKLTIALQKYVYEAAVFAKSLNSTAARLYMRAWLTLNNEDDPFGILPYIAYDPEDALKVVRLLRVAEERLHVDAALAALPKFKPAAKPRKSRSVKRG